LGKNPSQRIKEEYSKKYENPQPGSKLAKRHQDLSWKLRDTIIGALSPSKR
jgi:hypothetical protein